MQTQRINTVHEIDYTSNIQIHEAGLIWNSNTDEFVTLYLDDLGRVHFGYNGRTGVPMTTFGLLAYEEVVE